MSLEIGVTPSQTSLSFNTYSNKRNRRETGGRVIAVNLGQMPWLMVGTFATEKVELYISSHLSSSCTDCVSCFSSSASSALGGGERFNEGTMLGAF